MGEMRIRDNCALYCAVMVDVIIDHLRKPPPHLYIQPENLLVCVLDVMMKPRCSTTNRISPRESADVLSCIAKDVEVSDCYHVVDLCPGKHGARWVELSGVAIILVEGPLDGCCAVFEGFCDLLALLISYSFMSIIQHLQRRLTSPTQAQFSELEQPLDQ